MDDGRSEKLSTFLAVADCEPEVAQQYLESCAWDIDAAINTFLATGGAGGAAPRGDAAMAGDGALADALYEDEVRAPIAQMRGRLVEAPLYHMADGGRAGARGGAGVARAGVFEHVTHAKEAFRDFEQEASSLGAHGAGTGGAPRGTADDDDGEGDEQFRSLGSGAAAAATKKPKNLAAIYRPPLELCFRGSFDELRAAGREAGKWLLVNIQSPIEFASQQLNADTWRDEPLRAVLGAHFLFWQQYFDSQHGAQYVRHYLRHEPLPLPHVGILDPRTGELCKALTGFVTAERLMDLLIRFADRELQPMPLLDDRAAGGDGADVGAEVAHVVEAIDEAGVPPARLPPASGDASALAAAAVAPARADEHAALDDAYWAAYDGGVEASPGEGVVCLVVKMPDGSRSRPRHFAITDTLGSVIAALHASGLRVSAAKSWALVQPAPPRQSLSELMQPLSEMGVSQGKAMLILQEIHPPA